MKICMVGYGAIAAHHMKAFSQIDSVVPHILVGRRAEPNAAFAHEWEFAKQTLDLDSALADSEVDAVVITSPNALHVPQAKQALEAGKHVLLEIPIALTYEEAKEVADLSREVDRRLMVCHSMRYFPALKEVHRRATEGRFHIHQIIGIFGLLRRTNTTLTGQPRSWTDNLLWHNGAHLVDLALWVTGCSKPTSVTCRFGPQHPTQNIMDMSLLMDLPPGIPVTIAQSYNLSHFRWHVLFIGEEETLEFRQGTLLDGEGKVVMPEHSISDLLEQNREFVAAVAENRDPAITGEDVLPAMRVLQTAQEDADAHRS